MGETKKYRFSIIIAVYNSSRYLEDAINSIIQQKYDFDRVQIILVDDGSEDNSYEICRHFAEKYPYNILAFHQENAGVSSARNLGLEHATGEIINFLDSDDRLSDNTLHKVDAFFLEHKNETDVVSIPIVFFGVKTGPHNLNYKFDKNTRIIDLKKEWNCIQLSSSSSFIISESIQSTRFDTRLTVSEDAKFLQILLKNKMTLGVITDAFYYYRKRSEKNSAIDKSSREKDWYIDNLKYYQVEISDLMKDHLGNLPKYIQYALMYDLQWKLKQKSFPADLSDEEKKECVLLIHKVLNSIDDEIILSQRNLDSSHKLFVLGMKHHNHPTIISKERSVFLQWDELNYDLSQYPVYYSFLNITDNSVEIEGWIPFITSCSEEISDLLAIKVNDQVLQINEKKRFDAVQSLEKEAYAKRGFIAKFNLKDNISNCIIGFSTPFGFVASQNITYEKFFPISNLPYSHSEICGYSVFHKNDYNLLFEKSIRTHNLIHELRFLGTLLREKKRNAVIAVLTRIIVNIINIFKKNRKIWIISDRAIVAGDNGEALFTYMANHPVKNVKVYFEISKDSKDYERLRKIGRVVKYRSFHARLIRLLSEFVISSHADKYITFPFRNHAYYQDLLAKNKYVFLQHGIIKDDMSDWLNKYNKNFFGFITSAMREYESIIYNPKYYYDNSTVWLTGLSRYDLLYSDTKKYITLMPTWRKQLVTDFDTSIGKRSGIQGFEKSQFYLFYNEVLTNQVLLRTLEETGYKLRLLLHPAMLDYAKYFVQSENVIVFSVPQEYKVMFAETALLITDYSSTAFDFAYLRKPVIYTQFDKKIFFENHIYDKGYFDYEKDGFGEVEYTVENTINRILEYINCGCKIKAKYLDRIDAFFTYNDQNNCKRIIDKLLENSR